MHRTAGFDRQPAEGNEEERVDNDTLDRKKKDGYFDVFIRTRKDDTILRFLMLGKNHWKKGISLKINH